MEHRWGIRRTPDVGVTLYAESNLPRFGRMLNASSSGAYVATSATPPIMARVRITLGWGKSQHCGRRRIAAYVVRADRRGIGVEWQEFAPLPVLALIDALEVLRSRSSPGGMRKTTEARPEDAHVPLSRTNIALVAVRNGE
jgi:hypothetical protein